MRVNLLANLIGQGWTAALNLMAVPFYISVLGIDSFGLIGLFTVVMVVVSILDAGMTTTLNREMVRYVAGERSKDDTRDLLRSVEIVLGGLGALLILAAIAIGPLLADVWISQSTISAPIVSFSLAMMIIAAVLRVIEAIYRAALLGLHRPVLMNTISVLSSSMRIVGVFGAFAVVTPDIHTFFVWQVAIGVVTLICYALATHWAIGRGSRWARFDSKALYNVKGFAGSAFTISLLGILLTQTDKIVVPRLVSLREVGYYSAAAVIATGIYQIVLPIFHSFYPRLSYLHATGEFRQFARTYLQAARLLAVVAGCPIAIFMCFSYEVLFAWTGNAEVAGAGAPLLQSMSPGTLAYGLYHLPLAALLAAGAQRVAVRATTVAMLLLLPAMLIGFSLTGLDGIAGGWSVAMVAALALTLPGTQRMVLGDVTLVRMLGMSFWPVAVAFALSVLALLSPMGGLHGRFSIAAGLVLVSLAVLMLTAMLTWNDIVAARLRRQDVAL